MFRIKRQVFAGLHALVGFLYHDYLDLFCLWINDASEIALQFLALLFGQLDHGISPFEVILFDCRPVRQSRFLKTAKPIKPPDEQGSRTRE
ncbi:MAG: hypothetical protein ACRELG_23985 [Gemmataceae bacterium]